VPLNVAPSYEMVIIDDPAKKADEEMKDAASEEHTDEEIHIDDSPQPFIPQKDTVQEPAAPADETASATNQLRKNKLKILKLMKFNTLSRILKMRNRLIQLLQLRKKQKFLSLKLSQSKHHLLSLKYQLLKFLTMRKMLKRMHLPKTMHSLCSTQRLLLLSPLLFLSQIFSQFSVSHSPSVQSFRKKIFFEERMYFIRENPYDKPQMRHLKFWTRTQMNYYASVLCGCNKIFQHRHIPHVELEAIPCLEPVLSVLHDAGLLPMCSDISDWNSELILQFYSTLHISGNADDINTWVFDWMTQNTHYKAPASELLRELPVPIPSEGAVKLYGERELPNGMMEVLMKPLAAGKPSRTTFLVHELKYTPRSVYRILCSVLAPIKGHDDDEDVVGLMKNILFNIIHGIPMNIHDFFLRTLADNAMCPW